MSQLIDSSGGELELWLEAKAIYLLSERWTGKMPNAAAYLFLFTSSICQNIFSLDPLIEIFGTLMISILTRYSAVSLYPLTVYTARVVLLFSCCLYVISLQTIFLGQGHLCSVWGALRFSPVCHAKTGRERTIHSGPLFGDFLQGGTISTQNSWAEIL